jgi:hypothetical protein
MHAMHRNEKCSMRGEIHPATWDPMQPHHDASQSTAVHSATCYASLWRCDVASDSISYCSVFGMGGAIAGQSLAKLHTYGPYARVVLELSLVTHVQNFRGYVVTHTFKPFRELVDPYRGVANNVARNPQNRQSGTPHFLSWQSLAPWYKYSIITIYAMTRRSLMVRHVIF